MPGPDYTHDNASAEGIALAHTVYGGPANQFSQQANGVGENIQQATWSTAPYKPPARREGDSELRDRKLCSFEGCRAWPSEKAGGDYCTGHARKLGVIPSCGIADCGAAPINGTKFCHWHQPKMEPANGDAG